MMFSQQPRNVPSSQELKLWRREKKLFAQYIAPKEPKKRIRRQRGSLATRGNY